jgi:hypothetical protein
MKNLKQSLKTISQKEKWSNLGIVASRARLMQEQAKRESKDGFVPPLNHFIKIIYNLEKTELKTFKAWKESGFIVKKGEKGFVFFSAPRITNKKIETVNGGNFEAQEEKFFTCYLFASSQVEAISQ